MAATEGFGIWSHRRENWSGRSAPHPLHAAVSVFIDEGVDPESVS
jgi:hypothetical protein